MAYILVDQQAHAGTNSSCVMHIDRGSHDVYWIFMCLFGWAAADAQYT